VTENPNFDWHVWIEESEVKPLLSRICAFDNDNYWSRARVMETYPLKIEYVPYKGSDNAFKRVSNRFEISTAAVTFSPLGSQFP